MSNTKVMEGTVKGYKEITLYYRCWMPAECPKAVVVYCHGATLHSGFYGDMADCLVRGGYTIYAIDQRGHGKSQGQRCYIDHRNDYVLDIRKFIDHVHIVQPDMKLFMAGHSMGGFIASIFASKYQNELAGLIIAGSGTMATTSSVSTVKLAWASLISVLTPKLPVYQIDASGLSRDRTVLDAYWADPLIHHKKIPVRWCAEQLRMLKELPRHVVKIKLPILIMHGSLDRLNLPEGSRKFYELVASADKTLKLYDGLYHDIFNEPENKIVMRDMIAWLDARV